MKVRIWKALARGVVVESLRRKDLWVVGILGFLIMAAAGMLGFFGFRGLEIFAKDLAVTVLGILSTILAVLASTRVLPEEIKNRTLYPLLARPITRFDLLFGKYLGVVAVSWVAFGILAALTAVALTVFGVRLEPIMAQYAMLKMLGLGLLCSIGLLFSSLMTPQAATTLTLVLAFGSDMISRALVLAYPSGTPVAQFSYKLVNWTLPHFGLFDLGGRVANLGWPPVPFWVVGALAAYMIAYSGSALFLSWAKFRKQAL